MSEETFEQYVRKELERALAERLWTSGRAA